jgi:membrane protein DedA with SNARE-associated domain
VSQHPHLAGFTVFFIVWAESLAVVGLLLPGTVLIFAFGTLVGGGAMGFLPTYAWALVGALLGDGVSFWLGWRYRGHIRGLWPFRHYPELLDRGEGFFRRYGAQSILFGRFLGAVRGIVPLVAGMVGMPPVRFVGVTLVASALWVPVFLAPGILFGASLEMASGMTGKLVGLVLALFALVWFASWLTMQCYAFIQPRTRRMVLTLFRISGEHPLLGRITLPVIDPDRRDYGGLALIAAGITVVALILGQAVSGKALPVILEAWRTPWADYGFRVLEAVADPSTLLAICLVVSGWFVYYGHSVLLAHWLIAYGFAFFLAWLNGVAFATPPFDGVLIRVTIVFGFLATVVAPEIRAAGRVLGYALTAAAIVILAFARIYLERSEILAVVLALAFSLAWLVPLGIAYRRHGERDIGVKRVLATVALVLVLALGFEARHHSIADFAHSPTLQFMSRSEWLERGWSRLPAFRQQPLGWPRQPLSVQWAGRLEDIRQRLETLGWRQATPLTWMSALNWLNPGARPEDWPIWPHFNRQSEDLLTMIRPLPSGLWVVLRLWPSDYVLKDDAVPLWIGQVGRLRARNRLGFLGYFEEFDTEDSAPLEESGLLEVPFVRQIRIDDGNGRGVVLMATP